MADGPIVDILAAWRTVIGGVNGLATERTPISTAVPRLLAAVEAAVGFHGRVNLYGNASTEGEPGNCPHDPDSHLHFEDPDGSGEWLCEGKPEGAVCSSCVDGQGGDSIDWPCPEYSGILAALTGKAADNA